MQNKPSKIDISFQGDQSLSLYNIIILNEEDLGISGIAWDLGVKVMFTISVGSGSKAFSQANINVLLGTLISYYY